MNRNIPFYKKATLMAGSSFLALNIASQSSSSQDNNTPTIEEIIVTAQKRSEPIQDVPIAISAFDESFMKRANIDDVKDLVKFTPGFSGDSKDSFIDFISIRGISTNDFGVGGDPSIGFFKNGFYQGRNGVAVSSTFDNERAEVLRGPQGFLFGRNAIAGAVNIHTRKPELGTYNGYIDAGLGERNIREIQGAVNMPMGDNNALRLAAYFDHEDGYVTNLARPNDDKLIAHEKFAFRGTFLHEQDNLTLTLMAEYEDREQSGSVYAAVRDENYEAIAAIFGDIAPAANSRTINSDAGLGNFDNGEIFSLSGTLDYEFDGATLTIMAGFKDHAYEYSEDFDGLPIGINDYNQDQEGDYREAEIRLVSNDDSDLNWYAGLSAYEEDINAQFNQRSDEEVNCQFYYYYTCQDLVVNYWGYPSYTPNPDGLLESNIVDGNYKGWAAYLDLNYKVSETFELGFGVRYSYDKKNFSNNILPVDSDLGPFLNFGFTTDGPITESHSWDSFTPRAIARWTPNNNFMAYASVTKGYKSGGYASFAAELVGGVDDDYVALPGVTLDRFDPETVWSYELGFKADLMDKRLRLNANIFHYRYRDLQLTFFESGGSKVDNVGRVKATGFEATAQAVLSANFDVYLAASWISSSASQVPDTICDACDGNRLTQQPRATLAGVINYHQPVGNGGAEISASADFRTQSRMFSGLDNLLPSSVAPWTEVGARVSYILNSGTSFTLYVDNLFDELYYDYGTDGDGLFPTTLAGPSRPRTVGFRVTIPFGE